MSAFVETPEMKGTASIVYPLYSLIAFASGPYDSVEGIVMSFVDVPRFYTYDSPVARPWSCHCTFLSLASLV